MLLSTTSVHGCCPANHCCKKNYDAASRGRYESFQCKLCELPTHRCLTAVLPQLSCMSSLKLLLTMRPSLPLLPLLPSPQGDLFDEMKRSMGRMPESQLVTSVLLPMMSALLAMHAAGFIHRDIKPENTLFAANRVLKLAGGSMRSLVGSMHLLAAPRGHRDVTCHMTQHNVT